MYWDRWSYVPDNRNSENHQEQLMPISQRYQYQILVLKTLIIHYEQNNTNNVGWKNKDSTPRIIWI